MTTDSEAGSSVRAMPAIPVCWDSLAPDAARRELAELTAWVNQLVQRYELDSRTIPTCWHEHGALVEELSALRTAWLSCYTLTAPGSAPLAWHASFAACRARMSEYTARTGCTANQHRCKDRWGVEPTQ